MCGIVGYIGHRDVLPILLTGLKRLEYRGYDSAGIATISGDQLIVKKQAGKLSVLEESINSDKIGGSIGIGHTRWATHGAPNQSNAHPHVDCKSKIALIHNGIIENYATLRQALLEKGHKFTTDTDTEVVPHLIEEFYDGDFELAFRTALSELNGAYGFAVLSSYDPDNIYVARQGSPLVVGLGEGEFYLASDVSAIVSHTRSVFYLNDGEMAVLSRGGIATKTITNEPIKKKIEKITFDLGRIEKSGYPHYMLKEIFEQPKTITDAFRGRLLQSEGRVKLGGLSDVEDRLTEAEKIILIACGTSWHAALIAEYIIEENCRIPVEVEYASEFRYRNPVINKNDVIIVISQSGETADTLAALREGKHKGALCLGIVNSVGSTIARETDAGVYIHAGPEIGVASTKAFTSQVTVLVQIMLMIARKKSMSVVMGQSLIDELMEIP